MQNAKTIPKKLIVPRGALLNSYIGTAVARLEDLRFLTGRGE